MLELWTIVELFRCCIQVQRHPAMLYICYLSCIVATRKLRVVACVLSHKHPHSMPAISALDVKLMTQRENFLFQIHCPQVLNFSKIRLVEGTRFLRIGIARFVEMTQIKIQLFLPSIWMSVQLRLVYKMVTLCTSSQLLSPWRTGQWSRWWCCSLPGTSEGEWPSSGSCFHQQSCSAWGWYRVRAGRSGGWTTSPSRSLDRWRRSPLNWKLKFKIENWSFTLVTVELKIEIKNYKLQLIFWWFTSVTVIQLSSSSLAFTTLWRTDIGSLPWRPPQPTNLRNQISIFKLHHRTPFQNTVSSVDLRT